MGYKHVAISPESFEFLESLADSWNMDKKEFTEHMITYFRLTGEDPTATKKDNTVAAMKRLQNTLVSFIRTHETDHLKKIVDDFEESRKALVKGQNDQTEEIKKLVETAGKDQRGRLDGWMYSGIKMQDKTSFSIKNIYDSLSAKSEEIKTLIRRQEEKSEQKKQVIIDRLGTMEEDIKSWGALTKDGNKEKAAALINELKNLIRVAH